MSSNQKFVISGIPVVFQGRYPTTSTTIIKCIDGTDVEIVEKTMVRIDKIENDHVCLRFYSDKMRRWIETRATQAVLDNLFSSN